VLGIVHRDQQPLPIPSSPGEGDEAAPGPVALPCGHAFE
jgi:hypothetical protein